MVPADSYRISRVPYYSGVCWVKRRKSYKGLSPALVDFSKSFYFPFLYRIAVLQPQLCRNIIGLGFSAFARHYLRNHCYFLFLWVLRCFSSPRLLTDWQCDRCCLPGCPIRRFADLGIFAPPRNFSQLITSFFASESLGILHSPLLTFCCRGLGCPNPGYGIYFALARFFVL